jgi:hypothetical protein
LADGRYPSGIIGPNRRAYWSRSFAEVGGLISYGPYIVDEYRRAASYAERILQGSKPSELPVQTPVKFELVVNLKTAKSLGRRRRCISGKIIIA